MKITNEDILLQNDSEYEEKSFFNYFINLKKNYYFYFIFASYFSHL